MLAHGRNGAGGIRGVVMDRLPFGYGRGYAAPAAGTDITLDDPFHGLGRGATRVRAGGDLDPDVLPVRGVGPPITGGLVDIGEQNVPAPIWSPKPLARPSLRRHQGQR
jgi:hypothetical protein